MREKLIKLALIKNEIELDNQLLSLQITKNNIKYLKIKIHKLKNDLKELQMPKNATPGYRDLAKKGKKKDKKKK